MDRLEEPREEPAEEPSAKRVRNESVEPTDPVEGTL